MAENILPAFNHIQDLGFAEAASEPFLKRDEYDFITPTPLGDIYVPSSAGVAYITEDGPRYDFVLSITVTEPLRETNFFIEAYDLFIGSLHHRIEDINQSLPGAEMVFSNEALSLLSKTREARLRVIAGFAILKTQEQHGLNNAIIIPKNAASEMALEIRQRHMSAIEDPDFRNKTRSLLAGHIPDPDRAIYDMDRRIKTNEIAKSHGSVLRACTYFLPETNDAKESTSAEDRVGNFFQLSRKDRRNLLTKERKRKR